MESNSLKGSSIQAVHSIELKSGMHITGHCRTNPIDFGKCRMHSFFYRSTKKISYTLRPMESNSLKGSSIQKMYLIELNFGIYINRSIKMIFYILWLMGSNYLRDSSI